MDYQRLDTRVGNLEASLYGQRSYAQAITNVSSSLRNVSTSLAGVSTSLAGVSTSLGNVSTSLGGVSSSVSSTVSTIATYGNVVVQNVGTSGSNVPLLSASNSWGGIQFMPRLNLSAAAGTQRPVAYETLGVDRFWVAIDGSAEGGGNAGSNFFIGRFNDAGALIDAPISINRASGVPAFPNGLSTGAVAFASLPASPVAGQRGFINNSSVAMSGNYGAVAAGGGANGVPVVYDGANWRLG